VVLDVAALIGRDRALVPGQQRQVPGRVDPLAIEVDLEVHVASGGVARGSRQGQEVASADGVPDVDDEQRVVAVGGFDPAAVVHPDPLAGVSGPG